MAASLYTARDRERVVAAKKAPGLPAEPWRTVWRQDYARLLHSSSFRRLQGKKQLFPGHESDFFRNRLTHSLEVAQVAKSIANRINATHQFFKKHPLDTDLVETAALAHDLGHPPFGHNGEEALNDCMVSAGGFEGNAQTLRILSKLEKKQTLTRENDEFIPVTKEGQDNRAGLNLTYRTLAAVLKYDRMIPRDVSHVTSDGHAKVIKGYYATEATLVRKIKKQVAGDYRYSGKFKTIECSIMDVADDIAYSTYDIEDSFKAEFLSPLAMFAAPDKLKRRVAEIVKGKIDEEFDLPDEERHFDVVDLVGVLYSTFGQYFKVAIQSSTTAPGDQAGAAAEFIEAVSHVFRSTEKTAASGYYRTELTSQLVGEFISGVEIEFNKDCPPLSKVHLDLPTFKKVEVLKNYAREALIMSPRLKIAEHRGKQIIAAIFDALSVPGGHLLLPDDCKVLYEQLKSSDDKKRLICDFIAGMTDRYAIQFYGRLHSENPESIFSPL